MVKYAVNCSKLLRPWERVICCGASRRPRRPSGAVVVARALAASCEVRARSVVLSVGIGGRLEPDTEALLARLAAEEFGPPPSPSWVRYDFRHGIAAHRLPPRPDQVVNYRGQEHPPRRVTVAWPPCRPHVAWQRRCRVCGCTDEAGCFMGCWWVGPDLCSECVEVEHAADR